MQVLDYSAGVPDAEDVKRAGYGGAVRYLSPAREAWMRGKPIGGAEYRDFVSHGLQVAFVWQQRGGNDADTLRGGSGGREDAVAAEQQLHAIGAAGSPVFFAVDFDINLSQWNSVVVEYFKAAVSVLGRERVGIYGHPRVIAWAVQDGVVGLLDGGKALAWQAAGWSRGDVAPEAVLKQRPGAVAVGGVQCDVNDVLAPFWGQGKPANVTAVERKETTVMGLDPGQFQADITQLTTVDAGPRDPQYATFIGVHTYECPRESGAAALRNRANYQQDSGTGSYHILVAADGMTLRANDDDYGAAAALYTGNRLGLHLSFLAYARSSREEWLQYDVQLRKGAKIAADWCLRYGMQPIHLTAQQLRNKSPKGVCGHGDISAAWRESDHTDPGANFPWDVFLRMVQEEIAKFNGGAGPLDEIGDKDMAEIVQVVKEIKGQLTGSNEPGQFPGWKQLFGRTVTDGVAMILQQLIGPEGKGWPQLGQNDKGQNLTVVDAVAKLNATLERVEDKLDTYLEGRK